MTKELTLFAKGKKSNRFIESVDIKLFDISEYNPRKTKNEKHVKELSELIKKNGFDSTFALKCHLDNGRYKVFAGGNRLAASKVLKLKQLPVFVYEGYEPQELWRMAYDDNEQAGTQKQLSIVDVWMDYKEKADKGWTQQNIADSLGVSRQQAQRRIKYAELPISVLDRIAHNECVNERCVEELIKLPTVGSDWFDFEKFLLEIIENILSRTNSPTSSQFKKEVEKYNSAIESVQVCLERLSTYKDEFINDLINKEARSKAVIENQFNVWFQKEKEEKKADAARKRKDAEDADEEAAKAEREAKEQEKRKEIVDRIINGKAEDCISDSPDEFKLLFIDPPYGVDFQSNRRKVKKKTKKIANDGDFGIAKELLDKILPIAYSKMANESTVFIWCNWKCESMFMDCLVNSGFEIKGSLVWEKANHTTGDLKGTFAPKHERIIHATKGRVELSKRMVDVLRGNEFLDTDHPTPKPIDLMKSLIEVTTLEGEFVVDCFMGCGSTGVATIQAQRKFWGTELDDGYWEEALNNILNSVQV